VLRTRFNVRLHTERALASDVVVIVPFDSEVTAIARDSSGGWLYVGFESETGWGLTPLFSISAEDVEKLPVFSSNSPAAAATATATAPASD
jgi:hypothetical protein